MLKCGFMDRQEKVHGSVWGKPGMCEHTFQLEY